MSELKEQLRKLAGIHGSIAEDVYGKHPHDLECTACGRRMPLSVKDAARYLAHGWPKCCGYTMGTIARDHRSSP